MRPNKVLVELHNQYMSMVGGLSGREVASALVYSHCILELRDKIDEIFVAREFSSEQKLIGFKTITEVVEHWLSQQGRYPNG